MRPTFLGFETARKSISASQKALDITGHNLANIETTGYTRQRVDLFSIVTPPGGTRYSGNKVNLAGQGVQTSGISQIRDPFLDKRYRELNATASDPYTKSSLLSDVQDILDNIDTDGLQQVLMSFKGSFSSFGTDAADRIELSAITQQTASQVVNMLNSYSSRLESLTAQTRFELETSVGDVNATLDKIASLNREIVDSYVGNGEGSLDYVGDYSVNTQYGPNELLDARNVLLDSLSEYSDIFITNNKDGSVTVEMGGAVAVDGDKAIGISIKDDTRTGAVSLSFNSGEEFKPTAGSLKGYIDVYNGNGCYAESPQTADHGLPYFKNVIDEFARSFAQNFNDANVDANNPTQPKDLFVSADGTKINAGNIRISDEWIADSMYITPTTQDGALDNAHIMKMLSIFDKDITFGDKDDFTGSFEEYISYYTNTISKDISYYSGVAKSTTSLVNSVLESRDSVSAVSMDEEGINMMNYQKWFNASSRFMTTLDEALNTIINSMGLVGR